jgi:hypothetical protein
MHHPNGHADQMPVTPQIFENTAASTALISWQIKAAPTNHKRLPL